MSDESHEHAKPSRVQSNDGGCFPPTSASGSHEPRPAGEAASGTSLDSWNEDERRRVATLFLLLDGIDRDRRRAKPTEWTDGREAA